MEEIEKRFSEIRSVEGRRLEGVAIRYGDQAILPGIGPESFLPGAFQEAGFSDVILNVQHERGRAIARTPDTLKISDSESTLEIAADLPKTQEADDALELVRSKVLRGFSVEFRALKETFSAGIRVIEKAELLAVGLVDRPAYEQSIVHARAAIAGVSISFSIPYGSDLDCECHRGVCDIVNFSKGAFKKSIAQKNKDIIVVAGNYRNALASRNRGSLTLNETDGGIFATSTLADTQGARDLLAQVGEAPVIARPVFVPVKFTEGKMVATYTEATLRAITLGTTDRIKGWEEIVVLKKGKKRARFWL